MSIRGRRNICVIYSMHPTGKKITLASEIFVVVFSDDLKESGVGIRVSASVSPCASLSLSPSFDRYDLGVIFLLFFAVE